MTINKYIKNKKVAGEESYYFPSLMSYDKLDEQFAVAWHPATGLLVDEWMNMHIKYAEERDRELFFGVNNYGMVTCFFDVGSLKEARAKYGKLNAPKPTKGH